MNQGNNENSPAADNPEGLPEIPQEAELGAAAEDGRGVKPDAPGDAGDTDAKPQDQTAELADALQRALADFDNFRKRTAKERAGVYDDAVRDCVEKFLPVLDNLERALSSEHLSEAEKDGALYKGVEMTFKQFWGAFEQIGVTEIPGVGSAFDANVHNAVSHIQSGDHGENSVAEVMQKGYRYKDKVIRPGMVTVAN